MSTRVDPREPTLLAQAMTHSAAAAAATCAAIAARPSPATASTTPHAWSPFGWHARLPPFARSILHWQQPRQPHHQQLHGPHPHRAPSRRRRIGVGVFDGDHIWHNGTPPVALSDDDADGDGDPSGPLLPPPRLPLHWPHILASLSAGVIVAVCTCPLDVIRTRLAVQQQTTVYRGLFGSLGTTWREEGVRGLYRGFGPTIVVVPVFWATYFTLYSHLKDRFQEHPALRQTPMYAQHIAAAVCAGAVTDVVVNPVFVVRTRMQTQHMGLHGHPSSNPSAAGRRLYTSAWNTLVRLVREEGPMSLMRGVSASLLGLTHVMVQFPAYEWLKVALPTITRAAQEDGWRAAIQQAISNHPHKTSRDNNSNNSNQLYSSPPSDVHPHMSHLIVASSLSKLLASVLTFPHEVIRARLQNAPTTVFGGLLDCTRKTIRYEGWRALYKGFAVNICRTVPACVLTFVSYEVMLRKIQQYYGHH